MRKFFYIFTSLLTLTTLSLFGEVQQTLAIIKPDAVQNHHIGDIISRFEKRGLDIGALKMTTITKKQTEQFYAVHKGKPFFNELTDYISSGPIIAMVIKGEDAIKKVRDIAGATDPKKASPGTIRAAFGESTKRNAIHASDSPKSASEEIRFYFKPQEILN